MDCQCFVWNLLKFKKPKTYEDIEDDEEIQLKESKKKKNRASRCLLRIHISILNSLSKWIDRNIHERTASRSTQNFVNTVEHCKFLNFDY